MRRLCVAIAQRCIPGSIVCCTGEAAAAAPLVPPAPARLTPKYPEWRGEALSLTQLLHALHEAQDERFCQPMHRLKLASATASR